MKVVHVWGTLLWGESYWDRYKKQNILGQTDGSAGASTWPSGTWLSADSDLLQVAGSSHFDRVGAEFFHRDVIELEFYGVWPLKSIRIHHRRPNVPPFQLFSPLRPKKLLRQLEALGWPVRWR